MQKKRNLLLIIVSGMNINQTDRIFVLKTSVDPTKDFKSGVKCNLCYASLLELPVTFPNKGIKAVYP